MLSEDTRGSLSRTESLIVSFTQVVAVVGLGAVFIGVPLNRVVDVQADLTNSISTIHNQQSKFEAHQSDLVKSVSYLDLKFNSVGIATGAVIGLLAASGNVVKILEYFDKKEDQKRKRTESVEKE
jgi:hypothetical protein